MKIKKSVKQLNIMKRKKLNKKMGYRTNGQRFTSLKFTSLNFNFKIVYVFSMTHADIYQIKETLQTNIYNLKSKILLLSVPRLAD